MFNVLWKYISFYRIHHGCVDGLLNFSPQFKVIAMHVLSCWTPYTYHGPLEIYFHLVDILLT